MAKQTNSIQKQSMNQWKSMHQSPPATLTHCRPNNSHPYLPTTSHLTYNGNPTHRLLDPWNSICRKISPRPMWNKEINQYPPQVKLQASDPQPTKWGRLHFTSLNHIPLILTFQNYANIHLVPKTITHVKLCTTSMGSSLGKCTFL